MLSNVIGQTGAKQQILNGWSRDRMAHAYLLSGDEGLGAEELAIEATRLIMCQNPDKAKHEPCGECSNCRKIKGFQHPDVHYYFPVLRSTEQSEMRAMLDAKAEQLYTRVRVGGGTIHIGDTENPEENSVRALTRAISLRSFEGNLKVFILTFVEEMNAEATNALLKILEEPPASTLFFLTTANVHGLLPTILSRCQLVKLHKLAEGEFAEALRGRHQMADSEARFMVRLSDGNYATALQMIQGDLSKKREAMLAFLLAAVSPRTNTLQKEVAALIETAEKDKTFFTDVLNLMMTWFQDVFYMGSMHEQKELLDRYLINHDKTDRLDKFIKAFPRVKLEETLMEIEKAVDLIGRNVYINLILMNLGLNLRKSINPNK